MPETIFPPFADPRFLMDLASHTQSDTAARRSRDATNQAEFGGRQASIIIHALAENLDRISADHEKRGTHWTGDFTQALSATSALSLGELATAAHEYWKDVIQRSYLFLDAFRQRGDAFLEHEAAGCPPVLVYDYEVAMDAREFERPCNYRLLRIVPPEGVKTIDEKRPYVIIDPRAGHGAGIGGFKQDSQVGVALKKGHPVYFVSFTPDPVETQTLADVMRAEATFVREIQRLHPDSNKPIIIGNCQGGWATALLAASNPDITGPIVLNGSPMSYWSGTVGKNPMRYNGGLLGGVLPALVIADLSGGKFDGAWLVQNFEQLNPSRNFFSQYYDLFRSIDKGVPRFLEFQKWWGGYFWMTEAEIRWIVENLFVGNRLARGDAELEPGRFINVKNIRAPIITFASWGDNITPPQQALNWIVDAYASEEEIKLAGQRIIYMVHEKVGHLGIFVSSSIAKREHSEVASTMKTIESLAPGLYEMVIEDIVGEGHEAHFVVSFQKRKLADIAKIDDGRDDEKALAAVARASELSAELYDIGPRPFIQAMATPMTTGLAKINQPLRAQRWMFASSNPLMGGVADLAERTRVERAPAAPDNPFVALEKTWAEGVSEFLDFYRDVRDMMYEISFYTLWANPWAISFGAPRAKIRTKKTDEEMRLLPEVQAALLHLDSGGYAEAVIRMLIMLAEARGSVRRDRLERSAKVLSQDAPFKEIGQARRGGIIHEQSIIVQFDPEGALAALPKMIDEPEARSEAITTVEYILGPVEEMEPHTIRKLQEFRKAFELAPIDLPEAVRIKAMEGTAIDGADHGDTATVH